MIPSLKPKNLTVPKQPLSPRVAKREKELQEVEEFLDSELFKASSFEVRPNLISPTSQAKFKSNFEKADKVLADKLIVPFKTNVEESRKEESMEKES